MTDAGDLHAGTRTTDGRAAVPFFDGYRTLQKVAPAAFASALILKDRSPRRAFLSPFSALPTALVKLLIVMSVLTVGLMGYAGLHSLNTLNRGSDLIATTQAGRYQLSRVLQLLVEMGSGTRRFEASHDETVFSEARQAAAELPGALTDLQQLLAEDSGQVAPLQHLQELVEQRQRQTQQIQTLAITAGVEAMNAALARGEGRTLIEESRTLISAMQAHQIQRWDTQRRVSRNARFAVAVVIIASAAIGAMLILLAAYAASRNARRLRLAEEELVTTLRSIGDAVISTDADGKIRFINSVAESLTGWPSRDARDRPLEQVFKIVHEETRHEVENPVSRVLRDKAVVGLANHTVLIDRHGREHPIEDSGAPIYSVDGSIVGVVLVFRDAATQREAQRAIQEAQAALLQANATLEKQVAERTARLAESETLTRTFFEHSSECHAILSQVGETFRYDEVNPETLKLYGKSRDEVIGHTLEEVLGPVAGLALKNQMSAGLAADVPFRYERDHGQGALEAMATPIRQGVGTGRRIVVSARDVTERHRLEQQLRQSQKMEAVGQLTGGLAHDFNNLLTAISGSLELIEARVAQGRFENLDRFMAAAKGGAKRAAALTHRLLAFSRRQTLDAKPTDVNRLVADMVELIRRTVGPAITVDVVGGMGLWQPLVDANQLENALLNLCINARDAMPDGGRITIETANRWLDARMARERELPQGQYVSLCVSDTGCGMSPEVASRAFDPFFTTKPLGEGTGLGLSMIYGFARQSGGQVKIYSEVGTGAMVCLYLPRHQGDPAVESSMDELPVIVLAHRHPVLVVDDEPSVRMLVTEVLQDLGCDSIECQDGMSALKVLESPQTIDLLVTDVGLPNGMNGRQLADFARVLRPKLKVLFITGYAENAVFSHGQVELGFEVLSKPFSMEELAARIAGLIEKS